MAGAPESRDVAWTDGRAGWELGLGCPGEHAQLAQSEGLAGDLNLVS